MGRLEQVDLTQSLSRKEEQAALEEAWERLSQLRLTLGGLIGDAGIGPPVCVVFEGWDASGKGGCIKRLLAQLDPRHVRVVQFAAPTSDEKRHHFLWRFWPVLPGWGGMAIFDRSWYGRVMVERVEELATREQWLRAYDEINAFERTLADEGMILIKFWLHISEQEQLRRFQRRGRRPAEDLEADRGGLAQPGEADRLPRGGRGHAGSHRPASRPLARGRRRLQTPRPGRGDQHGHRADRGGDEAVGLRATCAAFLAASFAWRASSSRRILRPASVSTTAPPRATKMP